MTSQPLPESILGLIRDVPDYPKPGVMFKDITPLLDDAVAFQSVVTAIAAAAGDVTKVAGLEARGFLLAAPVALALGVGVVPVRKSGKLPSETYAETYDLEYGTATIEIHRDALRPADRVLIVDDVLATGGTAAAAASLVRKSGAEVAGLSVLMELTFLGGRERLADLPVHSLVSV
ncbi:adenine phosphoribosyltransferase [Actinocorallia sp. A-T 12471]|uniref:adenine phosphoribosyltransferase n=1 Tax=Actinocorallia sp. A-T 12471 TaxID=3089813 RepID=UPI0029CBD3F9|nr:adenine phosphoribosyltransferase [Actinocorallia sp. A-T 12471]MDX6740303.1 adenine phosphoribosyltransferase [Actinocorallia sp. A-T 12471]